MKENRKIISSCGNLHGMCVALEKRFGGHVSLHPEGNKGWSEETRWSAHSTYPEDTKNLFVTLESGRYRARYENQAATV